MINVNVTYQKQLWKSLVLQCRTRDTTDYKVVQFCDLFHHKYGVSRLWLCTARNRARKQRRMLQGENANSGTVLSPFYGGNKCRVGGG